MKNKAAFILSSLLVLVLLAVAAQAQNPSPSPTPHTTATPDPKRDAQPATPAVDVTAGNYNIITSIDHHQHRTRGARPER
jgi:hypothetical protein